MNVNKIKIVMMYNKKVKQVILFDKKPKRLYFIILFLY